MILYFSVSKLMDNRITLLHESETMDRNGSWHKENRSRLWNFNLHYFEYLHPLTKQFLETGSRCYLEKTMQMIRGRILQNPKAQAGDGWTACLAVSRVNARAYDVSNTVAAYSQLYCRYAGNSD